MTLSELQQDAMLTLANTFWGHDFVSQEILCDLLSMKLVYWRTADELKFTPAGESVYQVLAEKTVNFP